MTKSRLQKITTQIEWRWTFAQAILGLPALIASFALPAWAAKAVPMLEQFEPLSWVIAGFFGLGFGVGLFALSAWARGKWVRSSYDSRMLAQGGAVDPLEKTFERKRIYLNEFCLPSHPLVEDKTFIDCEIIGPANILFVSGNNITQGRYPVCDAVRLKEDLIPNANCYLFRDCIFRGCNFSRITFFVPHQETEMFRNYNLVRWITGSPYDQGELELTEGEGQPSQSLLSTVSEKPL